MIYVDILTGENLKLIYLANRNSIIWQFVNLVGGGSGGWGILILAEYFFNRVQENLVQHPSNNISITLTAK